MIVDPLVIRVHNLCCLTAQATVLFEDTSRLFAICIC